MLCSCLSVGAVINYYIGREIQWVDFLPVKWIYNVLCNLFCGAKFINVTKYGTLDDPSYWNHLLALVMRIKKAPEIPLRHLLTWRRFIQKNRGYLESLGWLFSLRLQLLPRKINGVWKCLCTCQCVSLPSLSLSLFSLSLGVVSACKAFHLSSLFAA